MFDAADPLLNFYGFLGVPTLNFSVHFDKIEYKPTNI
jgi:hypothetical protein